MPWHALLLLPPAPPAPPAPGLLLGAGQARDQEELLPPRPVQAVPSSPRPPGSRLHNFLLLHLPLPACQGTDICRLPSSSPSSPQGSEIDVPLLPFQIYPTVQGRAARREQEGLYDWLEAGLELLQLPGRVII